MNKSFPAKLLLFGEYTVLNGSRALAMPLTKWSGYLAESHRTQTELVPLAEYILAQKLFPQEASGKFLQAAQQGLQFISDIPQGYGAGSSGALCAAIYDQFFAASHDGDLNGVRTQLASMESFYHGTSSGMDPLVSWVQKPVLKEGSAYHCLDHIPSADNVRICIIDSGTVRSTGHFVPEYLRKSADAVYFRDMIRPLMESSDHAISFLLENYTPMLWEHLQLISRMQFEVFRPMITPEILPLWQTSLETSDVVLKLCGAGGGGFYLAFVRGNAEMEFLRGFPVYDILS
jgi:mevalonate kinase